MPKAIFSSIEQSEKALSDNMAIAIATTYASHSVDSQSNAPKIVVEAEITSPPANIPPVIKVSKDAVDSRMREEAIKINGFFKKDLQDPQNIMRQDIEKEYKAFCDGKIEAKKFKEKHSTKLYKKGLDVYIEKIAQLQEDKKLLLKPIDTPENLKAYIQYFSDKRITKFVEKSIDKFVGQIFAKKKIDVQKTLKGLSVKGESSGHIVEFAEKYAGYKEYEASDSSQEPEMTVLDKPLDLEGLYHAAESVNTLAYNKEHIVWAVNKTLGYDISPSYEQNIGITVASLGASAAMSFISSSPIPLASSALFSAGGISGAAEMIMGEEHVDQNAGTYISSNVILSSAINVMAFCSRKDGVDMQYCAAGVVSLEIASALSKATSDTYALFSTALMMGFNAIESDAPLYMKSIQLLSMSAKACHRMADFVEGWTSKAVRDTSDSMGDNIPQEPEVALGSSCGLFDNSSVGQNVSGQCDLFQDASFIPGA